MARVLQTTRIQVDDVFRALASRQRREILAMLGEAPPADGEACCSPAEVCACRIAERMGLAPSTISHHMSVLVKAGLVSARKDGLWVHYALKRDVLEAVADELASI